MAQASRVGAVGKEKSEGIGEKLVGEIKNLVDDLAFVSKGREAKDHPSVCLPSWFRAKGQKRR